MQGLADCEPTTHPNFCAHCRTRIYTNSEALFFVPKKLFWLIWYFVSKHCADSTLIIVP